MASSSAELELLIHELPFIKANLTLVVSEILPKVHITKKAKDVFLPKKLNKIKQKKLWSSSLPCSCPPFLEKVLGIYQ